MLGGIFRLLAYGAQGDDYYYHYDLSKMKDEIADVITKVNYNNEYFIENLNADIITHMKSMLLEIYRDNELKRW